LCLAKRPNEMYFYIETINLHTLAQAAVSSHRWQRYIFEILSGYKPWEFSSMDAWPNGKALDYESRDSRFDP
jgi:hypothetical protein